MTKPLSEIKKEKRLSRKLKYYKEELADRALGPKREHALGPVCAGRAAEAVNTLMMSRKLRLDVDDGL